MKKLKTLAFLLVCVSFAGCDATIIPDNPTPIVQPAPYIPPNYYGPPPPVVQPAPYVPPVDPHFVPTPPPPPRPPAPPTPPPPPPPPHVAPHIAPGPVISNVKKK